VFNGTLDLKIYTGVKITVGEDPGNSVTVTYTDNDGSTQNAEYDKLDRRDRARPQFGRTGRRRPLD
jgi:hypothetical protein